LAGGTKRRLMKRSVALGVALTLAVLVASTFMGASSAQPAPAEDAVSSQTTNEEKMLFRDARSYASDYGVSLREAVRRLKLQQAVGDLGSKLEAEQENTFAGLFIQHEPNFQVVVRFTKDGSQTIASYVEDSPIRDVVKVEMAEVSLSRLRAIQQAATNRANDEGAAVDSHIDVPNNRVVLRTTTPLRTNAAVGTLGDEAEDKVVEIRTNELAQPEADIYAGLALYNPAYNPPPPERRHWCTSGFAVRTQTGNEGITTAAHCSDDGVVLKRGGTTLPLITKRQGTFYDVEWRTTPGFEDKALFYTGVGTRQVNSLKGRGVTNVGDYMCKYGQTTGYECGNVLDTSYDPNYPNGIDYYASFILVYKAKGAGRLSDGGDSGGPWFIGNSAAGIHSGGFDSQDFWYSIYMPINFVSGLNVSVQVI
jgi:streptogrisin C